MYYYNDSITSADVTLFVEVATLLGDSWTASRDEQLDRSLSLSDTARPGVSLRVSHGGGRFAISAYTGGPHYFSDAEKAAGLSERHEISVTDKKTAKQIKGEIERRILPTYVASLKLQQEAQARQDKRHADDLAELEELQSYAAAVATLVKDRDGHADRVNLPYDSNKARGSFKLSHYPVTNYKIELDNITPAVARKILALVNSTR
jgi:hypothetical protein